MPIDLDDIRSGYNLSKINSNFQKIEDAWDEKLDRLVNDQGNQMEQQLDMNSNKIINYPPTDLEDPTDLVRVDALNQFGDFTGLVPVFVQYIGDGVTTNFTKPVQASTDARTYQVYLDGIRQDPNIDYGLAGTDVVFVVAPGVGVEISIFGYNPIIIEGGEPIYVEPITQSFVGDGVQTQYIVDADFSTTNVTFISLDGVNQEPVKDFTNIGGVIEFTEAPPLNSEIFIRIFGPASIEDLSTSNVIATGSTEPRTLADRFSGTVNVKDFGAVADGITDNTAAFQAVETYILGLSTPGGGGQPSGATILFEDGTYVTSHASDYSSSNVPVKLKGNGSGSSKIIAQGMTPDQVLFKFDRDPSSRLHGHGCIEGLTIVGTNSDNDPVLYSALSAQEVKISDFKTRTHKNIGMLMSGCFNCEVQQFEVFGGRYTKNLHKELDASVTFSYTLGDNTLTASASVFDSGDVGKKIVLQGGGGRDLQTIGTYISPTQVQIVNTFNRTATTGRMSFVPVTGTVSSGSNVITLSSSVTDSTMIGRVVIIPKAKGNNNAFITTIVGVPAGNQIQVDRVVPVGVTDEDIIFGGGCILLNDNPDGSLIESEINDIQFTGGRFEGCGGTQLFVESGIHVGLTQVKLHGSVRDNTFAAADWLLVGSATDSIHMVSCDLVHGYNTKGRIRFMGNCNLIQLDNFIVTAMERGIENLIYAPASDINYSTFGSPFQLSIGAGGIWGNAFDGQFTNADFDRVYSPFPIGTPTGEIFINRTVAPQIRSHTQNVEILTGTAIQVPVLTNNGFIQFADNSQNRSFIAHFAGGGVTRLFATTESGTTIVETLDNTPLTGITGNMGAVTVSYVESEKVVYIENRSGSTSFAKFLVMN